MGMTELEKAQKSLTDAQSENATLKTQASQDAAKIQTLTSEVDTLKAANTKLSGDLDTANKKLGELTAENSTLKADAKSAEQRAAEIVAKAGIKPVNTDPTKTDAKSVHEQFASLSDPVERGKFYEAHEKELLGLK